MLKALGGLLLFTLGAIVGWAATGQYTAEWVGAIGQWAGAIGTIAAIVWAVHTFRHETQRRDDDIDRQNADRLKREFDLADAVKVRCSGGSASGFQGGPDKPNTWSLESVWIRLMNGTGEPVTIEHFDLPGITFRGSIMRRLPNTLTAGQTFRETIDIEPVSATDDEVSDKGPLKGHVPVFRYTIAGATWERTGDDPPLRLNARIVSST